MLESQAWKSSVGWVFLAILLAVMVTVPAAALTGDNEAGSVQQEGSEADSGPSEDAEAEASGDPGGIPVERVWSEDILVTSTASDAKGAEVPYVTQTFSAEDLRLLHVPRTLPEALADAGAMVQKTGHGQGSPYLRGFTGFRTLLLIDGVRLNHSAMRDGPNQYWNGVDLFSIEQLEIVEGPGSVLYGSDAVGGVVQVLTRRPGADRSRDSPDAMRQGLSGSVYARLATAEDSAAGRVGLRFDAMPDLRISAGLSYKDFGDLEAGPELGVQPRTGYEDRASDLRVSYFFGDSSALHAYWQESRIDNAWRTHSTIFGQSWRGTTVGSDRRRVLDQERDLGYLRYESEEPASWLDRFSVSVSFQRQGEERDRIRSNDRRDIQGFDLDTYGLQTRFERSTRRAVWTWGLESYVDHVDSFRSDYNADGSLRSISIQGPVADDATYRSDGLYAQGQFALGGARLIAGARWSRAEADARRVADPITGEVTSIRDDWQQLTGNLRLIKDLGETGRTRVFAGLAQGFRAPNLSDVSRFDVARSGEVETPAPGLDAEDFLTFEAGFRYRGAASSAEISLYRTEIDGLIVRVPTGRVVDGGAEVTKLNAGDGWVHGVKLRGTRSFAHRWTVSSTLSWLDGEVETFPSTASDPVTEPFSRLQPAMASFGLRRSWTPRDAWCEAVIQAAERADRLSSRDLGDTQRIPPGGTPSYTVLTLRGGLRLLPELAVSLAIENLTDEDYRIHGSGLNEPGRNYVATASWTF